MHQAEHREAEQAEVGEEAREALVLAHVADAEDVHERRDERDHREHRDGQAVDVDADVEEARVSWSTPRRRRGSTAYGEVDRPLAEAPARLAVAAALSHEHHRADAADEAAGDAQRADAPGQRLAHPLADEHAASTNDDQRQQRGDEQ